MSTRKGRSKVLSFVGFVSFSSRLRYHRLHPEYLHQRIEKLGAMYQLRVLLVMCDVVSWLERQGDVKGRERADSS